METMLGSLESDEVTVTRCRQVLTLWITGLDALARERNSSELLPRVHPYITPVWNVSRPLFPDYPAPKKNIRRRNTEN